MKKSLLTALATDAIIATGVCYAFSDRAITKTCSSAGKTYMCSEAWTAAGFTEAFAFAGLDIHVRGTFDGPDYGFVRTASSRLFYLWPASWEARVAMPWKCAYSGPH